MGNKINTVYKLSSVTNADDLKCAECVICKNILDLNLKTIKSCEQCFIIVCDACNEQREDDQQEQCPVCRQDAIVPISTYQRKTIGDTKLNCVCGDTFTIKELPKHSNTCLHLKCPICKDILSTSCRSHIQTLAADHDTLKADHAMLQDNYNQLLHYCQQLEQHCGELKDFIRSNGWEATFE